MIGDGWEFFYRLIFPFVAFFAGLLDFAVDYPLFAFCSLALVMAGFLYLLNRIRKVDD